ncbi:MAG: mechanosensitive ion channel [Deltaproteobacteria bacterium]|nr:mechanosensitive ion channel [Deltaproteobacteria bacterium]
MGSPFDLAHIDATWSQAQAYFSQHVLSWSMAAQIVVIGCALLLARQVSRAIGTWLTRQEAQYATHPKACADLAILLHFVKVIGAFIAFILVSIAFGIADHFNLPRNELYAVGIILIALTVMRLFTDEMENRFWARVLAIALWVLAFLYIFHLIHPWQRFLQSIDFQLGQVHVSLLHVQRGFILLLALYWVSKNLRIFFHFWLTRKSGVTPAVQILLYRLGSIFLFSACVVIVLHYLEIDLTVFALFSGALGLGLGFGLQKVFANLVSGFIILADKSIKPGDVIQLGDKYGWINFLGSRYVSVITRDATEHLIPNENLITGEVINWSYSQNLVRLKVPVGVAYGSDLEKARELMLAAAAETLRVLKDPKPACLLTGFGDNAVNLEVRVWINDPQNGLGSVKSDLFWGIWQRFRDHDIVMPYPQRDVYLKSIPDTLLRTGSEEG